MGCGGPGILGARKTAVGIGAVSRPEFHLPDDKYHKSPAQIILRWHIQMGLGVVPGSRSKEHIEENGNPAFFPCGRSPRNRCRT